MSLIKCEECKKEISSKAKVCPSCGNPINNTPVEIELTNKKWKFVKVVGWVWFLVGTYIFLAYIQQGGFKNLLTGFGFSLGIAGFVLLLIAKFGSWWGNR